MHRGSWHSFQEGKPFPRGTAVVVCETHIRSGGVENQEEKLRWLQAIRDCPFSTLVYSPSTPKGWGRSPMNPNCWKTPKGDSIWSRHKIPRWKEVFASGEAEILKAAKEIKRERG